MNCPLKSSRRLDSPQWGSAANIAVEFADSKVLAFLGTIDGDATHVALRVALKIETFMVNCSDPDPTLTETQIPWLLRVFPDNRQEGLSARPTDRQGTGPEEDCGLALQQPSRARGRPAARGRVAAAGPPRSCRKSISRKVTSVSTLKSA